MQCDAAVMSSSDISHVEEKVDEGEEEWERKNGSGYLILTRPEPAELRRVETLSSEPCAVQHYSIYPHHLALSNPSSI